jgi:2-polyprenyl-6-hydroxyphenyl methylase/3-demethylubiquinone-9 3-methyltransferase
MTCEVRHSKKSGKHALIASMNNAGGITIIHTQVSRLFDVLSGMLSHSKICNRLRILRGVKIMVASQVMEPEFPLQHPVSKRDVNSRIRSVVLDIRARHGAMRILGIGRGAQPMCHHFRDAGYSVGFMEFDNNSSSHSAESTAMDNHDSPFIDPSPVLGMPFEMAISIESERLFSEPSSLVNTAAMKLEEGGILVVSIPYSGYLKNLMSSFQDWWKFAFSWAWNSSYLQQWSKKCLVMLLESHGFKVIEYIGVRGPSLEWEVLMLVAKKVD